MLQGVTFSVRRGESLALVGVNGAGKTTLVKLLTRLYEPTGGRILLNGMPAERFSPRSVQREIATVFQDFGTYQMTVRRTWRWGAARARRTPRRSRPPPSARAPREFVGALPKGFEQMLGRWFEGGQQLSGGQWQRLALARLYYRDGSVLVFDEPTARR